MGGGQFAKEDGAMGSLKISLIFSQIDFLGIGDSFAREDTMVACDIGLGALSFKAF